MTGHPSRVQPDHGSAAAGNPEISVASDRWEGVSVESTDLESALEPGGTSPPVRTVVLVGLAVNVAFVLLALMAGSGRPAWFVTFGHEGTYRPFAERVLGEDMLVSSASGHDGQVYWLQARDPALLHGASEVKIFDRPAYRAQRMLYPTLASPFRLGGEAGLLWGLVIVNLLAIGAGTYAAARLAVAAGGRSIVGLAFALNPLVMISALLDFGDALALAALVGTVLLIRERHWRWAIACAVAAVLAKEVNLLPLAAIALTGAGGMSVRRRVQLMAVPVAIAALWGAYARWRLGWPPSRIEEFAIVPFWGYADAFLRGWSRDGNWADAAIAAVLVGPALCVVLRWWRRRTIELTAALPFALLVPFLSANVLVHGINSVRALGPALTLVAIDWYADPARRKRPADVADEVVDRAEVAVP